MEDKNRAFVVLSGGMDSAVALAHAIAEHGRENVETVTFNYGSKHNDRENAAALNLCNHFGVLFNRVNLPFINELFKSDLLKSGGEIPEGHYADPSMKRTVVPFRNGIMLAIAAGLAESRGATKLYIGNHAGDHAIYPDCRAEFINSMGYAIMHGTYAEVDLISPFCSMTKTAIAKRGQELGVPFELTYSCYKGGEAHCGACGTCYERREAFRDSGVPDPTQYLPEPAPAS